MNMSMSENLAELVFETQYTDFPRDSIENAKRCLLDWLGVALAGSLSPEGRIASEFARELGSAGNCSILGHSFMSAPVDAAFANGIMGHSLDLDDFHNQGIVHVAAAVMPAALATAEAHRVCGEILLSSIILGYEVMIRIGMAVAPYHMLAGFHPTGTCGVFGAAAAAAKVMQLSRKKIIDTLGIAGMQASGLLEFGDNRDKMTKRLNPGRAAANGVASAILADRGFTGSSRILDGDKGFLKAFLSTAPNPSGNMALDIGKDYQISSMSMKPHSCCRAFHSAIDAALHLRTKFHIDPNDISEILVRSNRVAVEQSSKSLYNPSNSVSCQMSLPYNLAKAIIRGEVFYVSTDALDKNAVRLASKVKVELDEEIDSHYPERVASIVIVRLTCGQEYMERVDYPKGDPQNPLTESELTQKFKRLTEQIWTSSVREDVILQVARAEEMGDITNLLRDRF